MDNTLRIVTYNFLSGGSKTRAGHWRMLQRHLAPDVLLTQESKPCPDDTAHACRFWQAAVPGRWGSGLFATSTTMQPIAVAGFTGWVVGGEVEAGGRITRKPLRIFSIHCPAGERGYVHSMHAILDALQPMAQACDLVLGGDFNIAAGYRERGGPLKMSRGEEGVLDRLADEFGLIACWQTTHPGQPLAQTLRWMRKRRTPYHCDGIFVPRAWQARLLSCEVVSGPRWRKLSDHNPVFAVIRR